MLGTVAALAVTGVALPGPASADPTCDVTLSTGTNVEQYTAADKTSYTDAVPYTVCLNQGYYAQDTGNGSVMDGVIRVGNHVKVVATHDADTAIVQAAFDFKGGGRSVQLGSNVSEDLYSAANNTGQIVYGNNASPYNKTWSERKNSGSSPQALSAAECSNINGVSSASCLSSRFFQDTGSGRDIIDTRDLSGSSTTHWVVDNSGGSCTDGWYSPHSSGDGSIAFFTDPINSSPACSGDTNGSTGEAFAFPTNAAYDNGADKNIDIWDWATSSTNPRMHEFWSSSGAEPGQSGSDGNVHAQTSVSYDTNPDAETTSAAGQIPGNHTSAREAGSLIAPSVYRGAEVHNGINHPLNISVHCGSGSSSSGYIAPAARGPNSGNVCGSGGLPFGTLLRLSSSFHYPGLSSGDISGYDLGQQKILVAMKKYGFLIDDGGNAELERSDAEYYVSGVRTGIDQPYYDAYGAFGQNATGSSHTTPFNDIKGGDIEVVCTPGQTYTGC